MGRRIRISGILLLVSGIGWLIPASGVAMALEEGQRTWRSSSGASDRPWSRRECTKRKSTTKARRRSCRQKKHRRKASAVAVPQVPFAPAPAPAATPFPTVEEEPDPDENAEPAPPPPPPPPLKKDPPTTKPWPEEPPFPGIPNCEIVEGDCSIYSDKFWELLAKYKRFEIGTGVYPYLPSCMEAQAAGLPVACATAIAFLYPDGSTGHSHWIVDPCAPNGWRFTNLQPPCSPEEETEGV